MDVFITGATGMVGANAAAQLVARGDHVRALVRSVDRAREILPTPCELVTGDVTQPEPLRAIFWN